MTKSVSLREYLEMIVLMNDRRYSEVAIEREKALRIKDESDKTALRLARQINDLHLANLNGEQARLLADRERFISRESYEIAQKDFGAWRDNVNAALSLGSGQTRGTDRILGYLIGGIGLLFGLSALVFKIVGH